MSEPRISGRLQRPPDFTGPRINTFAAVVYRHGVPGLVLATLASVVLLLYGQSAQLLAVLQPALQSPGRYLAVAVVCALAMCGFVAWRDGRLTPIQISWTLYLGALSIWEEWAFRLALPQVIEHFQVATFAALLVSNLLFGLMHYFTLRWRWQWCLGAFLGGMALSRQLELHADLIWVVGLHWVATFINTPRPPSGGRGLG